MCAMAAAVSGCGPFGSKEERRLGEDAPRPSVPAGASADERVIRGWIDALNAGDFDRAADYFAAGAVVEQFAPLRLRSRADVLQFNRGLPCRAEVTDVEEEGRTTLAAFRLREGRLGRCSEGGEARVRFLIEKGKIREWRQLPEPPVPEGQAA